MKRGKIFKSILSLALVAGFAVLGTACAGGLDDEEKIDKTKTQLTVKYYGAGYGSDWILNYKKTFEEKYKDFKNGNKTGVQVMLDGTMTKYATVQELESDANDVYFLEGTDFATFAKAGCFEDITSVVTGQNSDGKTIESKLDQTQKDYYTVNGKYYGLPHYTGAYGIIYNIDLFEENNLYIKKGATNRDFLISSSADAKSAGPDGVEGTSDDGLPATYDEFFKLCDEMVNKGITPICFTGQYKYDYIAKFMDNLVSNYNGVAEQRLYYTYNGTATKLAKVNGDGSLDVGTLETANVTTSKGYELAREAGVYYGANFVERLSAGGVNNPKYVLEASFGDSFTHKQAQKAFLQGDTAMLMDGDWWMTEASASITESEKQTRKFGWLPLPHATEAQVGDKQVYTDNLATSASVRSGLDDVIKELAFDFIKDFYTDDNLVAFTKTTSTFVGVDYKAALNAAESELTPYAKTLSEFIQNADVMYQISNIDFFNLNYNDLQSVYYYRVAGVQPLKYILDGHSAGDYFKAFYSGMKSKTSIWK